MTSINQAVKKSSIKRLVLGYKDEFERAHQNKFTNSLDDSKKALSILVLLLAARHLEGNFHSSTFKNNEALYSRIIEILDLAKFLSPVEGFQKPDKDEVSFSLRILLNHNPERFLGDCNSLSILGNSTQIWGSEARKNALNNIQKNDKVIDDQDLISFTQIYTPDWVVDFLVSNTIDPLIETKTENCWSLKTAPEAALKKLETLQILDPACGTGNFLIGAFEYLLKLNSDYCPKESTDHAANRILATQIFGAEIDKEALFIVSLALAVRCLELNMIPHTSLKNLELLDLPSSDGMGSLTPDPPTDSILRNRYDVVLANPPYIGRKLLSRELKLKLKKTYPHGASDLNSAFVQKCLDLLKPDSRGGIITQASVLTLPTFKKLRKHTLENFNIETVVDLGPGIFPNQSGEKINSALIVFSSPAKDLERNKETEPKITFFDLRHDQDKCSALKEAVKTFNNPDRPPAPDQQKEESIYRVSVNTISNLYDSTFNYQIPEELYDSKLLKFDLGSITDIKQGLATTDNKRFVKYVWEVNQDEINQKWFAYAKGAGSDRYYSPIMHVVDWQEQGKNIKSTVNEKYPYLKGKVNWVVKNESYYFKPGLCFSFVNTKGLSVRRLPEGCIFDVGASAIFSDVLNLDFLNGYLNSSLVNAFMSCINPTINNQVGDLKRIPIPINESDSLLMQEIAELAKECRIASKSLFQFSSPLPPFIGIFNDFADNTESFDKWHPNQVLESKNQFAQGIQLYLEKVASFEDKIRNKQEKIDCLVFDCFSRTFQWDAKIETKIQKWSRKYDLRLSKKTDLSLAKSGQLYAGLWLCQKILDHSPILESENIAFQSHFNMSLDKYHKSTFQTFLNRSFNSVIPEKLAKIETPIMAHSRSKTPPLGAQGKI